MVCLDHMFAILGCALTVALFFLVLRSRQKSVSHAIQHDCTAWVALVGSVLCLHIRLVPSMVQHSGAFGAFVAAWTLGGFAGVVVTKAGSPVHMLFALVTFGSAPLELLLVENPPYLCSATAGLCAMMVYRFRNGPSETFTAYELCFILFFATGVLCMQE